MGKNYRPKANKKGNVRSNQNNRFNQNRGQYTGNVGGSVQSTINEIKNSNLSAKQKNRRIKQVLTNQKYAISQKANQTRAIGAATAQNIASAGASSTPAVAAKYSAPAIDAANRMIQSDQQYTDLNTTDQDKGSENKDSNLYGDYR